MAISKLATTTAQNLAFELTFEVPLNATNSKEGNIVNLLEVSN